MRKTSSPVRAASSTGRPPSPRESGQPIGADDGDRAPGDERGDPRSQGAHRSRPADFLLRTASRHRPPGVVHDGRRVPRPGRTSASPPDAHFERDAAGVRHRARVPSRPAVRNSAVLDRRHHHGLHPPPFSQHHAGRGLWSLQRQADAQQRGHADQRASRSPRRDTTQGPPHRPEPPRRPRARACPSRHRRTSYRRSPRHPGLPREAPRRPATRAAARRTLRDPTLWPAHAP